MNNNSHQSNVKLPNLPNVKLPDLPEEIWLKIIGFCELDSLCLIYLVSKTFQQRIKNKKPLPFRIFSVILINSKDSRENPKSSTNDFLSHHKFLQRTEHYKLEFLEYMKLLNLLHFRNPVFRSMINILEIDINIFYRGDNNASSLESILYYLPNVTMLSFVMNTTTIFHWSFPKTCSKSLFLQYLSLRNGILCLSMDFRTCSFVEFSLDNVTCKNYTSIIMPHCLKKCDLSCYQTKVGLNSNCIIELQMSNCKELKTL
jgi:hypothetical protein